MNTYGLLINGQEVDAKDGQSFLSYDPATGKAIAAFARGTAHDVNAAVLAARAAYDNTWRHVSPFERGRLLQLVAARIREQADDLAANETRDCGKVLTQARSDVAVAARYFEFYGSVASALRGEQIPLGPEVVDFTVREPHGVCGQINTWNFPLNMAARSLAAALAAGNTAVLKTPELAPLTSALLGRIITEAGLPAGVVNVVHGFGDEAGAALVGHPDVDFVTFTGSVETGRKVAANAASNITPCVMELGGKSPTVVFADADVDEVADQLARAFIEANGQSCDLPSLAVVHVDVLDEFVERLVTNVEKFTVGPGREDPDLGPLISETQRDRVERYIASATDHGATVAFGGSRPKGSAVSEGWYIEPTVLTNVTSKMSVATDEIFGPVLSIVPFGTDEEAVRIANGTDYGLAAFVWTRDLGRGVRMTRQIHAGQVYVNCFSSGDSVMTPFGGFKMSGYGREKGFEALRTYSQVKNICISTQ